MTVTAIVWTSDVIGRMLLSGKRRRYVIPMKQRKDGTNYNGLITFDNNPLSKFNTLRPIDAYIYASED